MKKAALCFRYAFVRFFTGNKAWKKQSIKNDFNKLIRAIS